MQRLASSLGPILLLLVTGCAPPTRQAASPLPVVGVDVGTLVIRLTDEVRNLSVTIDDRLADVGSGGVREITFDSIPAGTHIVQVAGSPPGAVLDETREVSVAPGETTTILVAVQGSHWMARHWYWMVIVPVIMAVVHSTH